MQSYDVIGDIHGNVRTLIKLLETLGYTKDSSDTYQHPSNRKVIFLGDFVDRGLRQREVINIVRSMIDSGTALAVMGNHEFNAIAFYTDDPDDINGLLNKDYSGNENSRPISRGSSINLRVNNIKNIYQHKAFLDAYMNSPDDYAKVIAWFKTLPLWLDLPGIRVIHACWDEESIKRIQALQEDSSLLSDELLAKASRKKSDEYEDVELILKGKEIRLPNGVSFFDKDGNERFDTRVRWWDKKAATYKEAFMGPEKARKHIPDIEIMGDHSTEYPSNEPPVFVGHYWLDTTPQPLADNIACLDYSVARKNGHLVAYCWDGEKILSKDKFKSVARIE